MARHDSRTHTFTIKDEWYPRLITALPQTERVLMNYIGKFRDKNISVLNSPYPSKLVFNMNGEDVDILFRVTNILRSEFNDTISNIELPKNVAEKKSLNDVNVILIMLMRYYLAKKDTANFKNVMMYFAYCIYGLRFNVSWKPYGANPDVMRHCINEMTFKFDLKKLGSVEKWLEYLLAKSAPTYAEEWERFSDIDIDVIISALYTRISNALKKVRNAYEVSFRNKQVILENKEFLDGTSVQMEQQSFTGEVEKLSIEYTQEFFSNKPSSKRIYTAAKIANISISELQVTIDKVFDAAKVPEMKEFMNCIFTIFYSTHEYDDIRNVSVKNAKFLQEMDSIFRKGNTKDKNILKAKEIMDGWLTRGSQTFRKTTRQPTLADYRRGVYDYFLLMICGF